MSLLCVVLHDVSPATWADGERLIEALARLDGGTAPPVTRLVVPAFHRGPPALDDPAFPARLDDARSRGDELALHGWRHLDEAPMAGIAARHPGTALAALAARFRRTVLTDREGEFAALDMPAARLRLLAGIAWFDAHDWPVAGFVAPAWLMSPGTRSALERTSLAWTSTASRLLPLHGGAPLLAPCLTASPRSRLRRTVSEALIRARARRLADLGARGPAIVRLGLHPDDARHPRLVALWLDTYARLRDAGRLAVTKSVALQRAQIDTSPTSAPRAAPASTSLG